MKNAQQEILENEYCWATSIEFPNAALDVLSAAASAIHIWLLNGDDNRRIPIEFLNHRIGTIFWKSSNFLWRKAGFHQVEFQTVYIDPRTISVETAVHEMAHILDNSLGAHGMASIFGGGPADELVRYIGGEPDLCLPRFYSRGYEVAMRSQRLELNPTPYGRTFGPAEDFAESFRLAVLHPEILKTAAPLRYEWFLDWRKRLAG